MFLDQPNAGLTADDVARYEKLGLPAGPFQSVQLLAPRRGAEVAIPDTGSRQEGVTAYYWSLLEFCRDRYLRFLFAEADDETSQPVPVPGLGDAGQRGPGARRRPFRGF